MPALHAGKLANLLNEIIAPGGEISIDLINLIDGFVAELDADRIANVLNALLVGPDGESNQILVGFIDGLVAELDGIHLSKFLSAILSDKDLIVLLDNLLAESSGLLGPSGTIGNLLNGIGTALSDTVLANLWLGLHIEALKVLGIILPTPIVKWTGIEGWIRLLDIVYSTERPF